MEMLRKLHRTERLCWIVILVCIFLLFKWGIDLAYLDATNIAVNILHTTTVVLFITSGVFQTIVIDRITNIEKEIYDEK